MIGIADLSKYTKNEMKISFKKKSNHWTAIIVRSQKYESSGHKCMSEVVRMQKLKF